MCMLGRNSYTHALTGFPLLSGPFFSPFPTQAQPLFCKSYVGLWPVFGFDEFPA